MIAGLAAATAPLKAAAGVIANLLGRCRRGRRRPGREAASRVRETGAVRMRRILALWCMPDRATLQYRCRRPMTTRWRRAGQRWRTWLFIRKQPSPGERHHHGPGRRSGRDRRRQCRSPWRHGQRSWNGSHDTGRSGAGKRRSCGAVGNDGVIRAGACSPGDDPVIDRAGLLARPDVLQVVGRARLRRWPSSDPSTGFNARAAAAKLAMPPLDSAAPPGDATELLGAGIGHGPAARRHRQVEQRCSRPVVASLPSRGPTARTGSLS